MIPSPPVLRALALGAAAAVSLALSMSAHAQAPQPQAPARQCFSSRFLSSWTDGGDGLVYLRVGVHDFYELKLAGNCPDLQWTETIGLETRGGSSFICSGLDVDVVVPRGVTHTVPQRCMGTSLRKLSPEEVKALPAKHRP